jgi:hypothetical protein
MISTSKESSMSRKLRLVACATGVVVPWLFALGGSTAADETFKPTAIIAIPGGIHSFDIGFVDADIHTYAVADRTNATVDIIDTNTNKLVKQLTAIPPFQGVRTNFGASSGPDGVIIVDHREVWAGDAPPNCNPVGCAPGSTIKAIDIATGNTVAVMDTGGQRRADELCEDVGHETVLMANDDPIDSFITFWSTESHKMLGKISFLPGSTDPNGGVIANGIEQCKYDPRTHKYYMNIPATFDTSVPPKSLPGVVVVISRDAPFKVEKVIPVDPTCVGNAGLALGPDHQIALGCSSGPGQGSVIIDDRTGNTIKLLPGLSGDEIWYNPGDNHYFFTGDTSLGVVDPNGSQDAPAPTQAGSHSVAADMLKNQVYVPVNGAGGLCGKLNGCIAVFTAKQDDRCLTEGMPVLDHDDGDDPVFMRPPCGEHDGDDRRADRDR